ncbi:hypothetical protein Ana3638_09585 [Anaerocolumna sedimenticola]|uniref:Uncharacterized protein n=1 Tax=Anaerocolumna sedimenticola TaxID=2696063 RepID=A0A6P1TIN1_9FIRM|nr:hypothetical protein [Anaerocolumna sedimenticola]QHQ60994.1 hypothetical protein Ana3638_09585 [Anaerocolumna sedimenticola]
MIVRRIKETELMEARNISSLCFNWIHDTKGKTTEDYIKSIKENPPPKVMLILQIRLLPLRKKKK